MDDKRVMRRLAAIVAADVVGYSRLVRENEGNALAAVRMLRTGVVEPVVSSHGGRVVKTTGDGFLIEFASAVDAVEASMEIQRSLAAAHDGLALRMGINLGDVVVDGDDVFGDGVNIAARLEAIAEPGSVYVSSGIYEQAGDKVDASFEDIGPQILKNIDRPVRVYAIGGAPAAPGRETAGVRERAGRRPVIAVLLFTNMSPDADDEYFSDGLTEDIITELARFRDCRVTARNSTFQ